MISFGRSLPWVRDGQRVTIGSAAVFVLLVPVLIGFLLGATRAGLALYFPWSIGILFWVISSLGVWACLFAGSWLAALLLRPWNPPVWLVLACGAVLGSLPGRHFIYGAAAGLRDYIVAGRTPQSAPGFEFSLTFAANYLQGWAGVYVTWIVVGLVFDRWLTLSRSEASARSASYAEFKDGSVETEPAISSKGGSSHAEACTDARTGMGLIDRLPGQIGREIVAIEAEDHYVRIYTELGSSLILMRFSDALAQVTPLDGVRVHRSYWVRRRCVAAVEAQGRGFMLTLSNGLRVPVSHGYKEVARQAGFQPRNFQGSSGMAAPTST